MTIFALSTGPGLSGLAVIRISGVDVIKTIKQLTNSELPKPRVAVFKKFKDSKNQVIDEGILIWFPAPNSYTGEDMAEFHVHGSKAVIDAIYRELLQVQNCRLAEPGEFTKIAFINGKINLLKAEGISDLISSETEIQRQQAVKLMSGKSSEKFESVRSKLIKILSYVEAKIDFPDEDLPENILDNIKIDVQYIIKELKKIINDQKVGERIREGFKVAIIGPANAGKSSLLNYLADRDVAIVSEIAGTTRDVIESHLNLDGYPVIISDTAGIRNSKDEIEKKGIKLSFKRAEDADLKIIILEPKSTDFKHFFKNLLDDRSILIVNKMDHENIEVDEEIKKLNPLYISVKKNINLDSLVNEVKKNLENKFIPTTDIFITRSRHRENIINCINHLNKFYDKSSLEDFDKGAEDLRLAIRHLGSIVGKVDVEEILGSIFNDFCIGK